MKSNLNITNLPTNPGCYIYKDNLDKVIYVGKAKNIKKRVSNYFTKTHQDEKTRILVSKIKSIEYIVTDTENEALVLENTLIKKYRPKYNINLKDSRRYAHLVLTDEEYPRLLTARDKKIKGKYFGPFTSGAAREELRKFLIKTFKIRTCKRLPKKECLRYHIGLCDAPCVNKQSKTDYNKSIANAEQILRGNNTDVIKKLKVDLKKHSDNTEYEKAQQIKNQIEAILWLSEKQKMDRSKKYDEDIINYIVSKDKTYLLLFNIYKGVLENKQEYIFNSSPDFLEQFLYHYYEESVVPKEIVIPKKISESLTKFLESKRKEKLIITVPKIGEKKQLLKLVKKNIELTFLKEEKNLELLQKELNLNYLPRVIECFDISHLGGTLTVASMVQFKNGLPEKNEYRRFRIKTVDGNDDFASMREVVHRRYARLLKEREQLPDLIIIDGGKGQLSQALGELRFFGLQIPIISIAKKFEEIYVPGAKKPIILNNKSDALKLLQRIRDEAHRFAITYNKLLRNKKLIE